MELTLAKRKAWIHEELQRAGAAALKNSGPIRCDEKSAELVAKAYADLFEPALIVTAPRIFPACRLRHPRKNPRPLGRGRR